MTYGEWLDKLKEIITGFNASYHELAEYYSFKSAYEAGMTPRQAWVDCINWLDGK